MAKFAIIRSVVLALFLALVTVLSTACGGGQSSSGGCNLFDSDWPFCGQGEPVEKDTPNVDITGMWRGTARITRIGFDFTSAISMEIQQNGDVFRAVVNMPPCFPTATGNGHIWRFKGSDENQVNLEARANGRTLTAAGCVVETTRPNQMECGSGFSFVSIDNINIAGCPDSALVRTTLSR